MFPSSASVCLLTDNIFLFSAPWGILSEQEVLRGANGDLASPEAYKMTSHKSLDANHTHFVLYDDKTNQFGSEIQFRSRIENALRNTLGCSGVYVCLPVCMWSWCVFVCMCTSVFSPFFIPHSGVHHHPRWTQQHSHSTHGQTAVHSHRCGRGLRQGR